MSGGNTGSPPAAREIDGWKLPPIEILDNIAEKEVGQADNAQRARKIEEALKSYGLTTLQSGAVKRLALATGDTVRRGARLGYQDPGSPGKR